MRRGRRVAAALLGVVLAAGGSPAGSALSRAPTASGEPRWTTSVFSLVPSPGYPASVHRHTNGRVYAASYVAGDRQRSRVFEWSRDGTLLRSWTVPGQRLDADHGVQVAQQTRDGLLVLLETSRRRVLTLDVRTGRFTTVATLPPGSVPNYATWGPRSLFVTDYAQGILWRVRRSGTVQRWFSGPELVGVLGFGTTGIAYRPRQRDFLITQQTTSDASTDPTRGTLLELELRRGRPGSIRTVWTSGPTELPDGFAIARSGHVYLALVGPSAQLVELTAGGREVDRFPDLPLSGDNGSPVPFDSPSDVTFDGTSVLVANQSAVLGDASHQAILRVEVGERGRAPHLPRSAHFSTGRAPG